MSEIRLMPCLTIILVLGLGAPGFAQEAAPAEPPGEAAAAPAAALDQPPEPPNLVPVPEPSLEGLEAEVAEQLVAAREQLQGYVSHPRLEAAAKSEAYGELGRLYHAYGLTEPADAAYRNAHALAPEDPRWAYLLAYLYQQQGKFAEAVQLYGQALEIEETVPALIHLAEVLVEQGNLDDAEIVLRRVLSGSPESPSARALLGQVALSRGEHELAVEYLQAALRAVPQANRLHYPLALAYRGLGDVEKAQEHLAQRGEVGVRPPDPLVEELEELKTGERVHVLRGRTAFHFGDYQSAAREFRLAVEAEPESVPARVNLGSALGQLGDRIGAIHQFRRVLELAPENLAAHYNLGVLLRLEGAAEESLVHLEKAVELAPGDGAAWRELAAARARAGDPEAALEAYTRASGFLPYDAETRLGEVQLLVDLGRYEEARQRLEDTYAVLPRDARVVNGYARFLAASPDASLRDGARAVELAEALVAAQSTAAHVETLAMALAEAGRCEEAAEWQRRMIAAHRQAGETATLEAFQEVLARYEGGAPCRAPMASPG